jgi:hypothetical protein
VRRTSIAAIDTAAMMCGVDARYPARDGPRCDVPWLALGALKGTPRSLRWRLVMWSCAGGKGNDGCGWQL